MQNPTSKTATGQAGARSNGRVSPEQRFTRNRRCLICGGADDDPRGQDVRCFGFLSTDGKFAHCTRVPSPIHGGSGTNAHAVAGRCPCGVVHGPAEPALDRRKPGKSLGRIVATYPYVDALGELLFEVCRLDPKSFRQRRPKPGGGWDWSLGDVPRVLYRLPELLASPSATVYVCEGEKAVDALRGAGLVATCSSGGAGKWNLSDSSPLIGRNVVILPDADEPGRAHAVTVARSLHGRAESVQILDLPDLPPKADVFDWLERGGTADQLVELAEDAPTWKPAVTDVTGASEAPGPTPTDVGNGQRFVAQHGTDVRYVSSWGAWLAWDGRRWLRDGADVVVEQRAKMTARSIYREAADAVDDAERRALGAWARKSESRDRLSAMLWCARSEHGIPIEPTAFDTDPWLLTVRNGTLDLRTGKLRPHRREDLITAVAPVVYDPDAACPRFEGFIQRIFGGNSDLVNYIQRLCGYILTGDVSEQVLPIFHGVGANGKSTLLGVLLELLGQDLAHKAPANMLMVKRGDAHPTELASLHGKRLAVCVETGEGARIHEALIKELTGGDHITARRMREDFWTFKPTHKVILCTNHRPVVSGTDHAIWRRLRLVPFSIAIPSGEQDQHLSAKLKAELPGILAWCVRGCQEWQDRGLAAPDDVILATETYRKDEDVLGAFLAEHCVQNETLSAKAAALYNRYVEFTEGSGERPVRQREFGKSLAERGFERYTSNGTWYRGLGLRAEASEGIDVPY